MRVLNLLDINLAKMKGVQRDEKCILVWQVPVIEGEPYNPWNMLSM